MRRRMRGPVRAGMLPMGARRAPPAGRGRLAGMIGEASANVDEATMRQLGTTMERRRRLGLVDPISLMTPLGLIEGDVLTYLERHGAATLQRLIAEFEWPAALVTMAVGALIRSGLVRALQREFEVMIEPG